MLVASSPNASAFPFELQARMSRLTTRYERAGLDCPCCRNSRKCFPSRSRLGARLRIDRGRACLCPLEVCREKAYEVESRATPRLYRHLGMLIQVSRPELRRGARACLRVEAEHISWIRAHAASSAKVFPPSLQVPAESFVTPRIGTGGLFAPERGNANGDVPAVN